MSDDTRIATPDDILLETAEKMGKAVAHTQSEFVVVRTGRATPALVEKLKVEYYGTEVPLQQLAGFNVPEARLLVIQPYDKSAIKAIEKAIQHSDLGINPSQRRPGHPPGVPAAHRGAAQGAGEGREAQGGGRAGWPCATCAGPPATTSRRSRSDRDISGDELERAEKELEKLTHEYVAEIDRMVQHKEQELLEV